MKRILLVLFLLFMLTGCTEQKNETPKETLEEFLTLYDDSQMGVGVDAVESCEKLTVETYFDTCVEALSPVHDDLNQPTYYIKSTVEIKSEVEISEELKDTLGLSTFSKIYKVEFTYTQEYKELSGDEVTQEIDEIVMYFTVVDGEYKIAKVDE